MIKKNYRLSKDGILLLSFPAIDERISFSSILGLPLEIFFFIGTFLNPRELARAQRVSKVWYFAFGEESLWRSHLPTPLLSLCSRPAKVEAVYQILLKECWERGEFEEMKKTTCEGYGEIKELLLSPDGSWMISSGFGVVFLWRNVEDGLPIPILNKLGGSPIPEDYTFLGGMVSPHSTAAFLVGFDGKIVRWKGFGEQEEITGTLIAGEGAPMNPHSSLVILGGVMSKDGKWALTYGEDGMLVQWTDLEGDAPQSVVIAGKGMERNPHCSSWIRSCDISPDGKWALTVGTAFVIWKGFPSSSITFDVLSTRYKSGVVNESVISPDGSWALTVDGYGSCVQWKDIHCGDSVHWFSIAKDPVKNAGKVTLSLDGSWGFVCAQEKVLLISHLNSFLPQFRVFDVKNPADTIVISPFSDYAVLASQTKISHLYPKVKLKTIETERKKEEEQRPVKKRMVAQ